jgi:DNA-directed RNA polymerase subunit beta'
MTQGLTRVEELFEARTPKALAEISSLNGKVKIERTEKDTQIIVTSDELLEKEYYVHEDMKVVVKEGQEIKAKQILAKSTVDKSKITAEYLGVVAKISDGVILIRDEVPRVDTLTVSHSASILISDGDQVVKGQKLTQGHKDLAHLRDVSGDLSVQKYIVSEIKSIYASQ